MPAPSPTDEQLRDRVFEQARAGDFIRARQTTRGIVDRKYLREAWLGMLSIQTVRRDVQGIKELIVACPDHSLLRSHQYLELPLVFLRTGDVSGAREIANTMGSYGKLSLILIPIYLAGEGDFAGARTAASQLEDEGSRNGIMDMVDQIQGKQKTEAPEESNHT